MCAWMIYSTLLHAGEKCRSDSDAAYLAWFRSQVERINAFILRNSDIGEPRLKEMDSKMNDVSKVSCEETGEILRAYERVRNLDREKLQAEFDALLKIDRPPVMDPCL